MKTRMTRLSAAVLAVGVLCLSCGKNDSGVSNLTMTGSLSQTSSSLINYTLAPFQRSLAKLRTAQLQALDSYTISCVTTSPPITEYTASVGSDGAFSIGLPSGTAMKCSVNKASTGAFVASILFAQTNSTDLDGNTNKVSVFALGGSSDAGSFSFDPDAGTAVGSTSTISLDFGSINAFNPDGTYTIASLGSSIPAGYEDVCPAGSHSGGGGGGSECNGPEAGEVVYLKRVVGKAFTPGTTCQAAVDAHSTIPTPCVGTTGSDDKYALMVWKNAASFTSCGSAMGFSHDEAKAFGKADFTGDSSVSGGAFTWSPSATYSYNGSSVTGTITDGWKSSQARSDWGISNCGPTTYGGQTAYKCNDTVNNTYQIQIGGGCTKSDGSAFAPSNNDWSSVNWSGATCEDLSSTLAGTALSALHKYTCHPSYTSGGTTITLNCTNAWRNFNTADNTVAGDGAFVWSNSQIVAQNTLCSDPAFSGHELQQLQCYANHYRNLENSSGCFRRVETNWNATSASDFLDNSGPIRARNEHMVNLLDYLPGNSAVTREENTSYRGVRVNTGSGDSWTNCKVREENTITFSKIDDTTLLAIFVSSKFLQSQDNNSCVANQSQLGIGVSRSIFKLVKN